MAGLIDDLGIWFGLGGITPLPMTWQIFPLESTTGDSVFRVTYGGDMSDVKSYCYLRAVYQRGGFKVVDRRWIRLYPKSEREILAIPVNPEFQEQNISRFFEIQKWFKYYRLGINQDSSYTVFLEEFKPYPQAEG